MAILTITIATQTNQDYDGVDETIKIASGDIDGVQLADRHSCVSTSTDADCKTSFKNLLTAKGYTWDTEA